VAQGVIGDEDGWEWALEHGLPALPVALGEDDEVAISFWAGPSVGAVLTRHRDPGGDATL